MTEYSPGAVISSFPLLCIYDRQKWSFLVNLKKGKCHDWNSWILNYVKFELKNEPDFLVAI